MNYRPALWTSVRRLPSFLALPAKTDEKPYFKVPYKSSGEGDPVRLTLITSAARLAASVLAKWLLRRQLRDEKDNYRPGSPARISITVSRQVHSSDPPRGIPYVPNGRVGRLTFGPHQSAAFTTCFESDNATNTGEIALATVSLQRTNSPATGYAPRNRCVCLPADMLETRRRTSPLSGPSWDAN